MTHAIALALVALGTAVVVASTAGGIRVRGPVFNRLHFVTPITSLGNPLIAAGLCVETGWGLTAAEILLIAVLLFICGPVLQIAIGRLAAQHAGRVSSGEMPE